MTVIITDPKYKMTLPAARDLADETVIFAGQKGEALPPLGAASKHASAYFEVENTEGLIEVIKRQSQRPVILPFSARSLRQLAQNRERIEEYADILVSDEDTLEASGDKKRVSEMARRLNIPTPGAYTPADARFPCVVKPACGEKHGLKAAERYMIANTEDELKLAVDRFSIYGPPIIQEYLTGDGTGVSILMSGESLPLSFVCHKRLRELPAGGGPSTCCVSMYDKTLLDYAVKILKELSFKGPAMVEFKAGRLLEINPRVWGSYAMTRACKSDFTVKWARFKTARPCDLTSPGYKLGVKMRFALSDLAGIPGYLSLGEYKKAAGALNPFVRDGIFEWGDPKPFFVYLKSVGRKI